MFHLLFCRETGLHHSWKLSELEKTRRAYSIQLSAEKTFEEVHISGVNSVAVSPTVSGRFLLSGNSKGVIAIHSLDTINHEPCKALAKVDCELPSSHKLSVETVGWYPHDTGLFISSSVDGTVKAWDTNALQCVENFSFGDMLYHHQMSPVALKHSLVAVACKDSRVYLADLQSGSATHILRGHKKGVLSLAWSTRNPYLLASGSRDNKVLLWDIRKATGALHVFDQHNGKQSSEILKSKTAHNGHVNSLQFTSNGLYLLSYGTDDRLRLWDVMMGKNTLVNYGRISNRYNKGVEIAVSCTSRELVFLPSASNIIVAEIHTGKHVTELKGHYHNVNCCSFEKNHQEVYSGSNDTYILAWQPEMERCKNVLDSPDLGKDSNPRTQFGPAVYQDSWSSDDDS